jgi:hypothetical protein
MSSFYAVVSPAHVPRGSADGIAALFWSRVASMEIVAKQPVSRAEACLNRRYTAAFPMAAVEMRGQGTMLVL